MIYNRSVSTSSKPSGSIIAAAVIEIIGSVLAVLCAGITFVAFRVIPMRPDSAQLLPFAKSLMEAMMIFFVALSIFGIFTGVGLLRLKNWARITMLVWAGVTVFFSAFILLFAMFMPFPSAPNQPLELAQFTRFVLAYLYGVPFVIGFGG
jgi:hypothetical protein